MNEGILTSLTMQLQSDNGELLGFNKSSVLQGVLMERISPAYAEKLHEDGRKPYSQCILINGGANIWKISALNHEAREEIIAPLFDETFKGFILKHNDLHVNIINKEIREQPVSDLFAKFYSEEAERIHIIDFQSPTAFKKDGRYVFHPDVQLIYRSLASKMDSVLEKEGMYNPDTLEQLVSHTDILAYSVYSVKHSLEGVKIPAFMGKVTIRIRGTQTMTNFANLLFRFGNYSGIGIKTAIGMGHVDIQPKRRQVRDGNE